MPLLTFSPLSSVSDVLGSTPEGVAVAWSGNGRRNGSKKRDNDLDPRDGSPVLANAKATSESVALENHLNPSSRYGDPGIVFEPVPSTGVATVSVRETSEPPGRSVMN
jgi:hypothetical protein